MPSKETQEGRRKPPVKIPITFEQAVVWLLAVNPKEPVESTRRKSESVRQKQTRTGRKS